MPGASTQYLGQGSSTDRPKGLIRVCVCFTAFLSTRVSTHSDTGIFGSIWITWYETSNDNYVTISCCGFAFFEALLSLPHDSLHSERNLGTVIFPEWKISHRIYGWLSTITLWYYSLRLVYDLISIFTFPLSFKSSIQWKVNGSCVLPSPRREEGNFTPRCSQYGLHVDLELYSEDGRGFLCFLCSRGSWKMSQILQAAGDERPSTGGGDYLAILRGSLHRRSRSSGASDLSFLLERVLMSHLAGRKEQLYPPETSETGAKTEEEKRALRGLWRRSTRCGPFASEKHAEADSLQSLCKFSCDLPGRGGKGRPVGAWRWLSSSSSEKLTCRVSFRWQPRWSFLWEAFLGPRAGQISSLKVHLSRHVCVSLGIPRRRSESCPSWHPRKSRSSNSPLTVEAEEHFCKADEDVLSAL